MAIFTFTLKEGQISLDFFLSFYVPHKIRRSMKEFLHFYLFEHLPKNKINGISAGELIG